MHGLRLIEGRGMDSVPSIHPRTPSRRTVVRTLAIVGWAAIAAAAGALVIANGGGGGSSGKASPVRSAAGPKDPYYVVRAGDTFSTIAAKEGIHEALIRRLNPSLDPL